MADAAAGPMPAPDFTVGDLVQRLTHFYDPNLPLLVSGPRPDGLYGVTDSTFVDDSPFGSAVYINLWPIEPGVQHG